MKQTKRQLTKKLFFRKYPYKIELSCNGASYIKRRGIEGTIDACNSKESLGSNRYYWAERSSEIDKAELKKFTHAIRPFYEKGLKCRVEGRHCNFFLEDKETVAKIEKELGPWIETIWEPGSDEELKYLQDNTRRTIVDIIPYGKFTHKIVFKSNWKQASSKSFLDWLAKYPKEDYRISPSTKRYLSGGSGYCQDPFMYIADGKMLTMLMLFAGDNIKYTEQFVPRSTLLL